MKNLMNVLELVHTAVWGPWTAALFLGTGLILSARLRFFQVTGFRRWWGATAGGLFGGKNRAPGSRDSSSFENACTALAATVGTGNIVGVATALTAGGPGAVFWMWFSALTGMATAYAETVLGQRYCTGGRPGLRGPMAYMEQGLGMPVLGIMYAAFALLASLGMGSMAQANTISGTLKSSLGLPPFLTGIAAVLLAGSVIMGGAKRIVRFCARLMPAAAGLYFFFSGIVILSCADRLPGMILRILHDAFRPEAAVGGALGFLFGRAVRYGLSRGIFSNEAGLGSLAVLNGASECAAPEEQGMWAMFEVFLDTIVICTLTAMVILCADDGSLPTGLTGAPLASWCFSRRLGKPGELFVCVAMLVFAFATIIAWYYVGRQMAEYLSWKLGAGFLLRCYPVCYLAAVFAGCVSRIAPVWLLADIANALMAFPNLAAVVYLGLKKDLRGGFH